MIARQSQLFIPTLREAPADADAVSHKLLVRGGYIRQVSAGLWTFMPIGWRVQRRIPEIFRLKDRTGRDFILPLTHEETVTFHAREIQSYKELPQLWYHFQTKDRDEPRPRGGLLRVREFVMKDGYSFDRDEDGVRASFEANREAYKRIFER